MPTASEGVTKPQLPPDSGHEPIIVVPSRKLTWPEGVLAPAVEADTEASKFTDWPNTDGFGDDMIVVSVEEVAALAGCNTLVFRASWRTKGQSFAGLNFAPVLRMVTTPGVESEHALTS